ncbi:MAG: Abi family protein [Albidovulum sp.]|uniref:Abi family protein n=1 Tax=Albidovulum sp. TaxID=1872424 RepID=UPI003C97D82E
MGRHTWLGNQLVQKGGPYFFMTLPPYTKPHASASDRVQHLRAKGLSILRPNVAARKIEMIGYERLRIYFLSRRDHTLAGKPFLPGTSYNDILKIYECDAKLRAACFSAVGQFEILLRNRISEELSARYGSHPYFDPTAFKTKELHLEALQKLSSVYNLSKDKRAKHYKENYSNPPLPAIWTLKEFLTFGATSRLLKALDGPVVKAVALDFGVPTDQLLENWVEALVDLRNVCAHHDRLFNRAFQKQPQRHQQAGVPAAGVPSNKMRALILCLDHMMTARGGPVHLDTTVRSILNKYPEVRLAEVGF